MMPRNRTVFVEIIRSMLFFTLQKDTKKTGGGVEEEVKRKVEAAYQVG